MAERRHDDPMRSFFGKYMLADTLVCFGVLDEPALLTSFPYSS